MLDPAGWLKQAQALPMGWDDKVAHDCGPGRPMHISHDERGWRAYCHRCGEPGFVPYPAASPAERMARIQAKRAQEARVSADPSLPLPINNEVSTWPLVARVWLYKAGLNNHRIKSLGIYYHEPTDRVVLPIYGSRGELLFWQARGFTSEGAKYLSPYRVDRSRVVSKHGTGQHIVLTEDYLSAVRVGEVTEAWSILGTSVPAPIMNELIADGRTVMVWLDPDDAGVSKSRSLRKSLSLYGVPHVDVKSRADPKLLSREEIEWTLKSHY